MTRKQMPMILMLTAGALTALVTYFNGYGLKKMLLALLGALIIFYLIGCIIKMILDAFEKANAEVSEEGEVIEKSADEDTEDNAKN